MLPSGNTSTLRIEPVVPYCLLQRGKGRAGALEHEGIRGRDEGERRLAHHVEVDTGTATPQHRRRAEHAPHAGRRPVHAVPRLRLPLGYRAPREGAAYSGGRRISKGCVPPTTPSSSNSSL